MPVLTAPLNRYLGLLETAKGLVFFCCVGIPGHRPNLISYRLLALPMVQAGASAFNTSQVICIFLAPAESLTHLSGLCENSFCHTCRGDVIFKLLMNDSLVVKYISSYRHGYSFHPRTNVNIEIVVSSGACIQLKVRSIIRLR